MPNQSKTEWMGIKSEYREPESILVMPTSVGMIQMDDGTPDMYCFIDTGDTAWMLTASSLVLFMTPGVAFLYGGLARSKNAVNTIGMTFIVMGLNVSTVGTVGDIP